MNDRRRSTGLTTLRGPARERHERRRPRHAARVGEGAAASTARGRCASALQPGIAAAQHGFAVDPTFFDQTDEAKAIFADFPATAALYLDPDGSPRDVGTVISNPDLARTYALHRPQGPRRALLGPARAGDRRHRQAPAAAPGLDARRCAPASWSSSDLARYKAIDRDPTHIGYRGLDVYGMAPPSSAAARPSARSSTSSRAIRPRRDAARAARCTTTSRPRGWPTPTAARTSATPAT